MGCEATDRLAEALGGKTFLPVALPLIQQSAAHASWIHRHAALSMLAEMAMGCSKFMKPKATEVWLADGGRFTTTSRRELIGAVYNKSDWLLIVLFAILLRMSHDRVCTWLYRLAN